MDAVSYSLASKQAQRIEKFIENPDSTSGIVTVPKTIASGETVTVPAGRVAVLPNVVVDGDLVVEAGGEVFVPAGANFSDLEGQISTLDSTKQDNLIVNDPAVKTALNATGAAPIYACRAWVNFNGTGTVAIRASGNVSSITDNGVGDYTVNFITAMPDVNYSVASMCSLSYPSVAVFSENSVLVTTTTSSQRFYTGVDHNGTNIIRDQAVVQVQIFR